MKDLQITIRRADGLPIPKEERKAIERATERMFRKGYQEGLDDGLTDHAYEPELVNCALEYDECITFSFAEMSTVLKSTYSDAYTQGFEDGIGKRLQARNVLCGR